MQNFVITSGLFATWLLGMIKRYSWFDFLTYYQPRGPLSFILVPCCNAVYLDHSLLRDLMHFKYAFDEHTAGF